MPQGVEKPGFARAQTGLFILRDKEGKKKIPNFTDSVGLLDTQPLCLISKGAGRETEAPSRALRALNNPMATPQYFEDMSALDFLEVFFCHRLMAPLICVTGRFNL